MRQYLLFNTIILPSFHDSGSCVIGLILVFGSKQKPHHIANITISPISKSKYVIKRKLGNHFRNSKWIAFNNSTSFQVSCQNAIWKNGPTFANGTAGEFNINFLNVNLDEILPWCLSLKRFHDFKKKKRDRKKKTKIFGP